MTPTPRDVTDADTARDFLAWCCGTIGLGFHPDTPFGEYVERGTGKPVFDAATAGRLDAQLEAAFEHLSDVYGECLEMEPFKSQK